MKAKLLVFLVAALLLLAACGGDEGPIPAVCDVRPAFLDFGQILAPLEPNVTEDVERTFTVVNQVYTNSDRGNADLAGAISLHGPGGSGAAPEIRIVPALAESTFILPPREGRTYTLRASVRSTTEAGTYSGFVSLGLECGDIPFVVRVYVREDTPPQFVGQIGSHGADEGAFSRPINIEVDDDGWIYTLEDDIPRVQIFDSDWNFWRAWNHLRDVDGVPVDGTYFSHPFDVEVDPQGRLHLADIGRSRVYLFERDALLIKNWGSYLKPPRPAFETPYSLALARNGNVLVLDSSVYQVLEFDISQLQPQVLVRRWGGKGTAPGRFGGVQDIEVDSQGNVYLSDNENNAIHKFSPTGEFITRWGSAGSFIGQFDRPLGIGLDGEDNVYVCDSRNARVQKFDSEGRFLTVWGNRGTGPRQFALPYDVAVGPDGRIYVVDAGNHRVTVWEIPAPASAAAR